MPRNLRILPPADRNFRPMTVNGRTYATAPGSFVDVNESDGALLLANNWIPATPMSTGGHAHGGVGTTLERPSPATPGQHFLDTTIGAAICFDGLAWRNILTAVAV